MSTIPGPTRGPSQMQFANGDPSPTPAPGPASSTPSSSSSRNRPPTKGSGAVLKLPGRSFSLSIKSKGKLPMRTGLHDRRWDLDLGIGRSTASAGTGERQAIQVEPGPSTASTTTTTTTTGESSLRRTVSSGDTTSLRSSQTSPPPHPPPKDPLPRRPPDPAASVESQSPTLLQSARLKMSSKDQEAMRKLRLTMDMSDSGSSGGSRSPLSPSFANGSSSSHSHGHGTGNGNGSGSGRPPLGSRMSTLSRQIVSEDLDDGPNLPIAAQHALPKANADFVIAVIGHKGVGKSTVIRRATKAWGVSSPASTTTDGGYTISSCFSQIQPGGKIKQAWKVEFLEMSIELLQLEDDESLWPALVSEIHGTIICYDAQDRSSLKGLDVATRRLSADGRPAVMFGCKSDPDQTLVVDPAEADWFGQPFNVGLIEVTHSTSEGKSKMRNGLRWLLYKLEQRQRREQRRLLASDIEAEQQRHIAARLEGVASPPPDSDASSGGHRLMYRRSLGMATGEPEEDLSDRRSSSSSLGWMMKSPLRVTTAVEQVEPEVTKKVVVDTKPEPNPSSDAPLYMSLRALFDKLFGAIISLRDKTFIRAFFTTYRRFCTSAEVMQEFVDRFNESQRPGMSKDVTMWAHQKMTGTLIDWLQAYPGDLCDEETTRLFKVILEMIKPHMFMAHLSVELILIDRDLPSLIDVDQSWSLKPPGLTPASTSRRKSMLMPDELVLDGDVLYDLDANLSRSEAGTPIKDPSASASSLQVAEEASFVINRVDSGSEPKLDIGSGSNISEKDHKSVHSFNTANTADRKDAGQAQAQVHWAAAVNWVMTNDPAAFANELTRLHWELFCAIRPRDVLRHDLGKEPDTPVGKAIAFFNRISRWVTTMILASPKAKHRARIYERFTLIAHQLRRLHNYDSLYAVISGMQETSVHRLSYTHGLVQLGPGIEKDWQSHLKLMDPRGGYVHYRRALQADLSHDRAAIPLLTTLLGLISRLQAVRKEDKREPDGFIQWDKFARFDEILVIIPECQGKTPMVSGAASSAFRRLIEETPIITDEDALFARSRLLESGPSQRGHLREGTGKVLKKLVNLGL